MSIFETNGVVIKAQDFKENDKLIWLYTEKLGKIAVIAKGAKKSKSRHLSLTLPLCYGEFVVFKGKNLYTLSEGRITNSFQGLLNNLEKLTYSTYICELIDICVTDEEDNGKLFKDFVTCLYLLNTDALDYELLIRSFELKILKATGYGLNLDNCAYCKKSINSAAYINMSFYGGVCEECPKEYGISLSKGAYSALKYLNTAPMDKIYRLNINKTVKDEIAKITAYIINSNYSKKPKSLEMLNYIKE
ncbi:DNA repair protein RecO [Clostridium folliculivorans]|uniref:DNA repair protein RecO n=1 Tax=Clostridium folliculivorans TaxID=2886038 RepID=UPI0021C413FD|nr:DNA repair protein RecO [Clostridium folliculivorans]